MEFNVDRSMTKLQLPPHDLQSGLDLDLRLASHMSKIPPCEAPEALRLRLTMG